VAERLFTQDQANRLIPQLRPLLEQLRQAARVAGDEERRRHLRAVVGGNGGGDTAREMLQVGDELARLIADIEELGIVVRDPSSGLIDFPAEREGHPVYLCWRIDEESVAHWHDRDAGFGGREPL
jgi:hypothetical protein